MTAIALLVKKLGQRRVGRTRNTPRLVDEHAFLIEVLGGKTVHTTVEIRIVESMASEKTNNTWFPPIRTPTWPFDEYPSTFLESIFGDNLECSPNTMKQIPMFPNFLPTCFPFVPINMYPRRATRTRTRQPESISTTRYVALANLHGLLRSEIHLLGDGNMPTSTRPPSSARKERSLLTAGLHDGGFGLGRES